MTQIFGILNVTADSFSDGGRYLDPAAAIAQARALADGGADVIDIGAASSNPDAAAVGAEMEIARLSAVVPALHEAGIALSVDSFEREVQVWALAQGVRWLNDIQGFPDATLHPQLADSDAGLIVMHAVQGRGKAARIDVPPAEIMGRMFAFFDARVAALEQAGVARGRIVLDPGMGFFLGTDPETSLEALRRTGALKARYGLPVLISVSRKSFIRAIAGRSAQEAGAATLAAELFAVSAGAAMIRTHDPRALSDALKVTAALRT
ncbi:Dihydropteroate synthase [Alphaproteobacteria bacterium SO-S41]|nr:Dihydropteroate synthase [Alphaproteobacteria bacterium SO-S41]